MRTLLATAVCCLVVTSIVPAQAPQGAAPTLKVVSTIDSAKGHIVFLDTVYKNVFVQREVTKEVNGQVVKELINTMEVVAETREFKIDATKSRIITPDGQPIPIKEVWKRVKANTVVAFSADSKTPAAAYLKALNADTVVIIPAPEKKIRLPGF